jgi:pyridoxamine 5'-phosphate oxidase
MNKCAGSAMRCGAGAASRRKGSEMSIAHLRKEYSQASLSESEVDANPIAQFAKWFQEALNAEVPEANAMSVATVGANGRPSSRILLIKDFDARGFTWYTNYASRKGCELEANPYAALLFHWIPLERQVRIEGKVERVPAEESDAYFQVRPLKSRLGAIASSQSQPIASRSALEQRFAQVEAEYRDAPVRPAHWGGYRLQPDSIEFWQGRPSRLHDRIRYLLQPDGSWKRERLQP